MYGSIFRMKVKSGQEQRVVDLLDEWSRNVKPKVDGAIGGLLLKPDGTSGLLLGAAVFRDKAAYVANADIPGQDKWYQRLRKLLEDDPQWEDGEYSARPIPRPWWSGATYTETSTDHCYAARGRNLPA